MGEQLAIDAAKNYIIHTLKSQGYKKGKPASYICLQHPGDHFSVACPSTCRFGRSTNNIFKNCNVQVCKRVGKTKEIQGSETTQTKGETRQGSHQKTNKT